MTQTDRMNNDISCALSAEVTTWLSEFVSSYIFIVNSVYVVLPQSRSRSWDRNYRPLFHYSSQLQTWLQTWFQAGRKHVESQLRTCLKRVFFLHSICLARARTSEPVAVRDHVFDKQKSKAGRKRVANPHELVENLAANLVDLVGRSYQLRI